MMQVITKGSIFDSQCEYLTNTINTVGAMGAGLALEFRLRIPQMYELYKHKCERNEITVGEYWIYDKPNRMGKKILNFPVKRGFNHPSSWKYIIEGLQYFVHSYSRDGITSIAFPTLGARLGKLDDEAVLMMMEEELRDLPIAIEIYQHYGQDRLTKLVKHEIPRMSETEIARELHISHDEGVRIKTRVASSFLLSDLVVFHKMSVSLVRTLYDFGYRRMSELKLSNFVEA